MKHIKPDLLKVSRPLTNQLQRNKSGDKSNWQSPTNQSPRGQGFKSIIEEINQQNQRTFSQLDQDLQRIKNNLNRIEQESVEVQQFSQNQGLREEIQLLQQENERLREKNTILINEKKKMSREIQQYQSLVQREKLKQMSFFVQRPNNPDTKLEGLTANNLKLKQELSSKQEELQKLKVVNNQLIQAKSITEKRQSMLNEEKNKLLAKIMEIQKKKNILKLKFQEELKTQLDKKDAYYAKILKSQEAKFDQSLIKFKENTRKATLVKLQQTDLQNKDQIQRLSSENKRLKECERQLKKEQEKLTQNLSQCMHSIEGLTNEIELLSFSYKQTGEQFEETNEQFYDLRQKHQTSLLEVKKGNEEISGLWQRLEEQGKKCTFLQQLCNKLQKESQQNQYEAQHNYSKLSEVISGQEKELQRSRAMLETVKKEKKDLENQAYELTRTNEKYILQLKRKSEENIALKKENLVLLSDTKNLRLQNTFSPPKHEIIQETHTNHRLQRLHSARSSRQQLDIASVTKMRKIEKELNDLINECKQENDKTKALYKEKEMKLNNSINSQKLKMDELTLKIQQLEKEIQLKSAESNKRQQSYRELIRKKDAEILLQERKCAEIGLKLSTLESDNSQLKKKLQQFTNKKVEDSHRQCSRKMESLKQENKRLLNAILNEINLLAQTSQVDSNYRTKSLQMGLKEIKSYEQIQKIAQINFAFHALRQAIKTMNKRLKQLSQSTKSTEAHNQTSCFLDKSSLIMDENVKSLPLFQKKSQKILKFSQENEDSIQRIIAKSNEFERKYERQVVQEKRKNKEIEDLNEEIRQQKRQLSRLKNDLQVSQDERQDMKIKLKACQQRLARRQAEKTQLLPFEREQSQIDYKTPSKQLGFYRSNNFDSQRQMQETNLRSRVRSFRSCEKHQNAFNDNRDFQRKIGQYQIDIGKLNKQIDLKESMIEGYEKEKTELQHRWKKMLSKYQKKAVEYENLQERYELELRIKAQLQSKINELQYQLKKFDDKLEKQNRQNQQFLSNQSQQRQCKEKEIKELLYEKDVLEKKLKKQISERQEKIASISQQYDLKIIEMASQITRLKENTNDLKAKLETTTIKYEQMIALSGKNQEKIYQSQIYIVQLKQKLSRQEKQKQEMLSVFSSNTSKLSKIIQEKQIEIQQLKFIQESTIINLQYARTQQTRKRQDQSAFSFKHQF